MKIATNTRIGYLELNKTLQLRFGIPVNDYYPEKLTLMTPTDTLIPGLRFPDSLKRKAQIDYSFQPGELYQLVVLDSAFIDLSGAYNDSLAFNFKVREAEDYGTLIMEISVPDSSGQYIFQLMTEKENILRQNLISSSDEIKYEYLLPGNYLMKVIFDANMNGKWDTGNYKEKLLPERVLYYPVPINIRANWELREVWAPVD
jgi:hypothetical protein